jgi:hypothetical protein
VRIAVEKRRAEDTVHEEPPRGDRPRRTHPGVRVLGLLEDRARHEGGREHVGGAPPPVQRGNADRRIAGERRAVPFLVVRLLRQIELVGEAGPDLGDQRVDGDPARDHSRDAADAFRLREVGGDGVADPGVEHLHGDGGAVRKGRAVDLPE